MCTDSRLWKDIKTHKYIQGLKEHEEFHSFLDQKGSNGKSVAKLCSHTKHVNQTIRLEAKSAQ